jgi:hypothetical protein
MGAQPLDELTCLFGRSGTVRHYVETIAAVDSTVKPFVVPPQGMTVEFPKALIAKGIFQITHDETVVTCKGDTLVLKHFGQVQSLYAEILNKFYGISYGWEYQDSYEQRFIQEGNKVSEIIDGRPQRGIATDPNVYEVQYQKMMSLSWEKDSSEYPVIIKRSKRIGGNHD